MGLYEITCMKLLKITQASGSDGKASACSAGDPGVIPELGRLPGEGNGNPLHFSILAWKTPWTEEPGRLQPMRSQRAGHV